MNWFKKSLGKKGFTDIDMLKVIGFILILILGFVIVDAFLKKGI